MRLIQMEVGRMRNFSYLAGCDVTGEAALVDPAWEVEGILARAAAERLRVTRLLLTHTHHDHIEGLARAWDATRASIHVHALEAEAARRRLEEEGRAEAVGSLRPLQDGDEIRAGGLAIRAMHTPGHTPGACCYLVPGGVLTGDTLFIGRCGRTDFPGSDPEAMYRSLGRLASLTEDTVVYPGHNYAERPASTIGEERRSNVHMSAPDRIEFLRRRMGEAWVVRIREAGR